MMSASATRAMKPFVGVTHLDPLLHRHFGRNSVQASKSIRYRNARLHDCIEALRFEAGRVEQRGRDVHDVGLGEDRRSDHSSSKAGRFRVEYEGVHIRGSHFFALEATFRLSLGPKQGQSPSIAHWASSASIRSGGMLGVSPRRRKMRKFRLPR